MTLKKKMMIKKRAVYICVTAVFFFLAISIVNASLLDPIKNLFNGEPMFGPSFNTSVSIKGVAPIIVKVVNVTDNAGVGVDQITPTAGSITNVSVIFVAYDGNTKADLPTNPTYGAPGGSGRISMKLQKPTSARPSITINEGNMTGCTEMPCDLNCNNLPSDRMYRCNMTGMQYYYEPISNWFVNVTITDIPGTAGNTWNGTKTFTYNTMAAVDISGNIAWTNIDTALPAQTAATNLTLFNKGNKYFPYLPLTAYNLTSKSYPSPQPTAYLPSYAFRANTTIGTECSSNNLTENTQVNVATFLNYSAPGVADNDTMHFCIAPILNNIVPALYLADTLYAANGTNYATTGTNSWILTVT